MNTNYIGKDGSNHFAVEVKAYLIAQFKNCYHKNFEKVWADAKKQGWSYISAKKNAMNGRPSIATFDILADKLKNEAPNDFARIQKNKIVTFRNEPIKAAPQPAYANAPYSPEQTPEQTPKQSKTNAPEPDYKKMYFEMRAVNRMNLGKIAKLREELGK